MLSPRWNMTDFGNKRETLEHHQMLLFVACSCCETGEFLRSIGYKWKPWLRNDDFAQDGVPGGDIVARSG